jgi:tRNA(Ile)-lysidine synthase
MVEAVRVELGTDRAGYNPDQLLDPSRLSDNLVVRNWRPGDRFWPAHTKAPKKIKELLQERHITGSERKIWPVILSGDDVIWVRGFAVPATLQAKVAGRAILIRDMPLDEE